MVRWFDLFGVSEEGNNIAIVYIGCNPPPYTNQVTILWEEDFINPLTSGKYSIKLHDNNKIIQLEQLLVISQIYQTNPISLSMLIFQL